MAQNKINEVYEKFGQQYHDSRKKGSGRLYNEYTEMPGTFSLLPKNLSNKIILDAGCGSGIYATILAKKKAKVVGVDISAKMIEIANKETPKNLGVQYKVGDISTLPFPKAKFDVVVCSYVIENVKEITKVFSEFNRVLKKNGVCVFSVSHPLRAQGLPVKVNGTMGRVISNYFEGGMRQSDFGHGMVVPKYKRTLEQYIKSIKKSGFVLEDLAEPKPLLGGKKLDPEGYEVGTRIPSVLIVRLIKK